MTIKRLVYIFLFSLLTIPSFAGNPYVQGVWKGYLLSNALDSYNKNGLPVTLYIVDDNSNGSYFGEMSVSYRYQQDVYRAKFKVVGNVDYGSYKLTLSQTEIIFGDMLPKGLQWCAGAGNNFRIYRSSTAKRLYIDGIFETACNEKYRLLLFKK